MKYCIKCGKQIPARAEVCPYCGTRQETNMNQVQSRPRRHPSRINMSNMRIHQENFFHDLKGIPSIIISAVILSFLLLLGPTLMFLIPLNILGAICGIVCCVTDHSQLRSDFVKIVVVIGSYYIIFSSWVIRVMVWIIFMIIRLVAVVIDLLIALACFAS